jgi:Phosphotransferase enzyme family
VLEPIVTGRAFPDSSTCASYLSSKLAPVAARMRGRPEVAAFAAPASAIEALNVVVFVWPVDGELPTLVEATARERMVEIFRETLDFVVEDCEIELVSYRRRQRCVLRYTVADAEGGQRLVAYGKVSAVGSETPKDVLVGELHRRIVEGGTGRSLSVPRSLGWRPELQLSLLEALPGEALIGPALRARLLGDPPPGAPPLEEMVAACGHAAAVLHGSGIALGPTRTIDDELAGLQRDMAIVRPFVRDSGDRAQAWYEQVAALAEQSEPLPPCLSHGDFKYEQLLFDGARSALVDFDALCQAEPALDLGKFLAHLRVDAPLGEELAEQFLRAYVSAAGDQLEDERRLRLRTALYEIVSLFHLTLWSQRNLDETGLQVTAGLLGKRLASIGSSDRIFPSPPADPGTSVPGSGEQC